MLDFNEDDRAYVYAVAHRILKSAELANDAAQDTLLRAFRCRAQYRGEAAPRTWLYRIAVTTAVGYLRSRQRSREELGVDLAYEPVDPAPSPEEVMATRELVDQANALLGADDDLGLRILAMRGNDASDHDIARALAISPANVRVRACRTRQRLRAQLAA
ncbi:MAG TPA: RNA polymerase sigma factor [Kofleriaceae bacterium]|nr:RNA polymerase sigma factor [Kofleriaceae bacterium]